MTPTFFLSDHGIDLLGSPTGIEASQFRLLIGCFKQRAAEKASLIDTVADRYRR
jgi:hypothetical protein